MTSPSVIIELIVDSTQFYIVLLEILDDDSKYCQIIARLTLYVYIVIQLITTDHIGSNK